MLCIVLIVCVLTDVFNLLCHVNCSIKSYCPLCVTAAYCYPRGVSSIPSYFILSEDQPNIFHAAAAHKTKAHSSKPQIKSSVLLCLLLLSGRHFPQASMLLLTCPHFPYSFSCFTLFLPQFLVKTTQKHYLSGVDCTFW